MLKKFSADCPSLQVAAVGKCLSRSRVESKAEMTGEAGDVAEWTHSEHIEGASIRYFGTESSRSDMIG